MNSPTGIASGVQRARRDDFLPAGTARGQILIIFVVALSALLAFTALAIDVGMIYLDRRTSQNASDSAAMAGAGTAAQSMEFSTVTWRSFSCASSQVQNAIQAAYTAALTQAATSGFPSLTRDLSSENGVEVTCVDDPHSFNRYLDVRVMITTHLSTSIAHLFFSGDIQNTVNALARIRPRTELGFDQAVAALSPLCDFSSGGLFWTGSNDSSVQHGGVFSNGCFDSSRASGNIDVNGGGIHYLNGLNLNPFASVSPAPTAFPVPMPRQSIPAPDCGSGPAVPVNSGGTLSPGSYTSIQLSSGSLTLNPGLYCLSGNIDLQGGTIQGSGVTLYLQQNSGADTNLTIAPGAEVTLSPRGGLLVWMADGNHGQINIQGTPASSLTGAIYAPDGSIQIGGPGAPNLAYQTQLIARLVIVHSDSPLTLDRSGYQPYTFSPKLDVLQ